MATTHPSGTTRPKFFISKTQTIGISLVLIIVGTIIAGSFEKGSLINYAGFSTLLVGIVAFVWGTCLVLIANFENRVRRKNPQDYRTKKKRVLTK